MTTVKTFIVLYYRDGVLQMSAHQQLDEAKRVALVIRNSCDSVPLLIEGTIL